MSRDGVADPASIFVEGDIPPVVQTVLYTPVSADEFGEPVFIRFVGQQASDAVCDFTSLRTVSQSDFALHGEDLRGVGEVDLLRFNSACNQTA